MIVIGVVRATPLLRPGTVSRVLVPMLTPRRSRKLVMALPIRMNSGGRKRVAMVTILSPGSARHGTLLANTAAHPDMIRGSYHMETIVHGKSEPLRRRRQLAAGIKLALRDLRIQLALLNHRVSGRIDLRDID